MKTVAARFFASVLFGLLLSSALFAADYRYSKIDVPNSTGTIARGINARGDIIGDYFDADGMAHEFLLHNGVYTNIDNPSDGTIAVRAINARGDIVGNLGDAAGGHGFLLHDGQFTKIDFPGASNTTGFGINNTGDITGEYTAKSGAVFGYLLRDGTFRKISIRGTDLTSLHGAEDNGRVLTGDVIVGADSSTQGFIRYKLGDVQLLDPPGTIFPCSHARAINERGDVAGVFMIVHTPEECTRPNHGFVLRQGAYDIIDPPGSLDTFVFGINDDQVLVGVFTDPNGILHGFKATPKY